MVAMMRARGRSVMAWRCMRAATVVVIVMLMLMVCFGCGVTMVESARPMSAQEIVASTTLATSKADDGWSSSETATTARSNEDGGEFSGAGGVDPVLDAEAESPPAQRQRDRSLWGMSKRLVPTGPNPLHN